MLEVDQVARRHQAGGQVRHLHLDACGTEQQEELASLDLDRLAERRIQGRWPVEGQFARGDKAPRHPHTNLAKAGMNMLTRTSAADLAEDGIYLVSLLPRPPLRAEDAAARILHPNAVAPLYGVRGKRSTGAR